MPRFAGLQIAHKLAAGFATVIVTIAISNVDVYLEFGAFEPSVGWTVHTYHVLAT